MSSAAVVPIYVRVCVCVGSRGRGMQGCESGGKFALFIYLCCHPDVPSLAARPPAASADDVPALVACRSGNAGGLAERRAHGREVERAAERPGEVLQGPGLAVRAGDGAHQAAQQVRGAPRDERSFPIDTKS